MNLMPRLAARAEAGRPVRCALIGAGKFGSMFLAQVPHIEGLEVAVIADLDPERAKKSHYMAEDRRRDGAIVRP